MKLNKEKKGSLLELQNTLVAGQKELVARVREFVQAKNSLEDAAARLGGCVEQRGFSVFSPHKTLDVLLWVHSVFSTLACGSRVEAE